MKLKQKPGVWGGGGGCIIGAVIMLCRLHLHMYFVAITYSIIFFAPLSTRLVHVAVQWDIVR